MARPVPPPRRDRPRPRPRPRHSYEGFVEKRGPRDQPLEVLDLGELVTARAKGGSLVLRLRGRKVTLKMKVPTDLALLPGHVFQLLEALREERDRRATAGSPATPGSPEPPLPLVPSCFFEVTRVEAERLLERSAGGGNMVLRPGGHGRGVSVTTRQEMNGAVLLKHYKVNRIDQGYVIDVDTPHRCSSLAEVVQYFVESSKGSLRPLHREYSPRLEFVETDGENGEETQGVCEPPPAAPTPQPRGLSALKPPPSPHHPALQPPGRPGGPPLFEAIPEEHTYMNQQGNRDPQSSAPRPAPRRALLSPDHGMVEELTKKLQLRQALIED